VDRGEGCSSAGEVRTAGRDSYCDCRETVTVTVETVTVTVKRQLL